VLSSQKFGFDRSQIGVTMEKRVSQRNGVNYFQIMPVSVYCCVGGVGIGEDGGYGLLEASSTSSVH